MKVRLPVAYIAGILGEMCIRDSRDIVLCQYDDVMAELVEVKPSVQLQREFVIGSPWMHQASRGNASLQRCV